MFAPCVEAGWLCWSWMGCWCSLQILFALILLVSLVLFWIDIFSGPSLIEKLTFSRSLYWWKWLSSSGPSAVLGINVFTRSLCCTWNDVAWISGPSVDWNECPYQVPFADWNECLYQVLLLIGMSVFTRSLCWLRWVYSLGPFADWSVVFLRSLCWLKWSRFPFLIACCYWKGWRVYLPPQPYSLTCPQVIKTVETETKKTKTWKWNFIRFFF